MLTAPICRMVRKQPCSSTTLIWITTPPPNTHRTISSTSCSLNRTISNLRALSMPCRHTVRGTHHICRKCPLQTTSALAPSQSNLALSCRTRNEERAPP